MRSVFPRVAQLAHDLHAPKFDELRRWRAEAERRQQVAQQTDSQEVCPLSRTRIAELAPEALFFASDNQLYDRDELVAYVRETWISWNDPPKSPLTARALRSTDLVRLFSAPPRAAALVEFLQDKHNAYRLWEMTAPTLLATFLGASALSCRRDIYNADQAHVATAVGASILLSGAALFGVLGYLSSFYLPWRCEGDFLLPAYRVAYNERLQRYTCTMGEEEKDVFAQALQSGVAVMELTGRGSPTKILQLEADLVRRNHEQRTRFLFTCQKSLVNLQNADP